MLKNVLLAAVLLVSTSAWTQQAAPDTMTLQRTIAVLEQQRNSAMNAAAIAETRAAALADDLARVQAKLKELEPKTAEQQK